jgi:alkylated DNA repair dioxygenase AlkB
VQTLYRGHVTNVRSALVEGLSWQPSLLDTTATEPAFDASFTRATRVNLDAEAWVEHVPGWVSGAAELFAEIVVGAPWSHRMVHMYGRMVEEPRLHAWYDRPIDDSSIPNVISRMAPALSARYDRSFDEVGAALYRDGRDSVAWHGDRISPEIVEPVVALISLGSPRTLRMRARHRRNDTRAFPLMPGDLFVMGGMSQRTWEHSVPKVARAGARMSVQFRHSQ